MTTLPGAVTHEFVVACRSLWRAKGVTGAAVSILASGIAATTVLVALIQGVLLRPLPVEAQDRLIVAWKELRSQGSARYPFGDEAIEDVARSSRLLQKAAGVTRHGVGRAVLVDGASADHVNAAEVAGDFFQVLGVTPLAGRALTSLDDREGVEHAVVLSRGFWQRRYGASHDIIGRLVTLDEQPVRIVGVMPGDLDYPTGVDVWRTTRSVAASRPFADAVRREVNLVARMRPGVTIAQAAAEVEALSARLEAETRADAPRGLVPVVRAFADVVVGDVRGTMLALLVAVVLVLLIASANVANLLLMRAEERGAELALRAALGASRSRLFGLLLAESLVVSGLAGTAGFVIAWWSLPALVLLVPGGLPRADSVRIDAWVAACAIAVALASAFLAALGPALLSMRAGLVTGLRAGGGRAGSRGRARRVLVAGQVALAVTVVAAAGLLIQSVVKLQAAELGVPASRLKLLELHVPQTVHANRHSHARFLEDAIASLEAVPIIAAATPVNVPPFSGQGWDVPRYTAEGQDASRADANPSLHLESIHPNYFHTLQIPVVKGRAFSAADRAGGLDVAIVSADVAERTWPGENPIGKRLKLGGASSSSPWYVVVGVAGQTRYRDLTSPRPTLYLPAEQFQMTATMLVLRSSAPLELVASVAADRIRGVNRDVRVMTLVPFDGLLSRPLARPRFTAFLIGVFGLVALLLSSVGLYAVMAAYVRQRESEIAIRLALGATGSGVRRFVLAEAMRLAVRGASIGLAGAAAAGTLVRGLLYGIAPLDVPTLLGAALLLIGAAAIASYLPLRRATAVAPMTLLRTAGVE